MKVVLIFAIASLLSSSKGGTLYGLLGDSGGLVSLDPKSGKAEFIGDGSASALLDGVGAVDSKSKIIYSAGFKSADDLEVYGITFNGTLKYTFKLPGITEQKYPQVNAIVVVVDKKGDVLVSANDGALPFKKVWRITPSTGTVAKAGDIRLVNDPRDTECGTYDSKRNTMWLCLEAYLAVYDVASGKILKQVDNQAAMASQLVYDAASDTMWGFGWDTAGRSRTLWSWDAASYSQKSFGDISGYSSWQGGAAVNPDGKELYTFLNGGGDHLITVSLPDGSIKYHPESEMCSAMVYVP